MRSRKRGREEMEAEKAPPEVTTLTRLRNMWQFANLVQYLYIFGKAIRIEDDIDIEELERECLSPTPSEKLSAIGLALLKTISSHRGLTPEIFDEYTRRQFVAKRPHQNPFGEDEKPKSFRDFDIFTKIRVLYQLTQWTMLHPERLKEKMGDTTEQELWRIEPMGWDRHDRTYYILDDNRLYRRTEPAPPPQAAAKPKANSKKAKAAARASKRQRLSEVVNDADGEESGTSVPPETEVDDDGFGGATWECMAVTLEDFLIIKDKLQGVRDPNEKVLRERLLNEVLPVIEKAAEEQKRKALKREKELLNLEKLAGAKRSSRLAGKQQREKEEADAAEAERKRLADIAMTKKEEEKMQKRELERESRLQTREQRAKEREARRILLEEELANLSEEGKKLDAGEARISERQLKANEEKRKQALEELGEEDWVFDCAGCGKYGENYDDGTNIIACDKCNVWQHLACLGIGQATANKSDFTFVCKLCIRKAEDAKKAAAHPPLKIKFKGLSSSPPSADAHAKANGQPTSSQAPSSPSSHLVVSQSNGISPKLEAGASHARGIRPSDSHISSVPSLTPSGQHQPTQTFSHNSTLHGSPFPTPGTQTQILPPSIGHSFNDRNGSYRSSPQVSGSSHPDQTPKNHASYTLPPSLSPERHVIQNGTQPHGHSFHTSPASTFPTTTEGAAVSAKKSPPHPSSSPFQNINNKESPHLNLSPPTHSPHTSNRALPPPTQIGLGLGRSPEKHPSPPPHPLNSASSVAPPSSAEFSPARQTPSKTHTPGYNGTAPLAQLPNSSVIQNVSVIPPTEAGLSPTKQTPTKTQSAGIRAQHREVMPQGKTELSPTPMDLDLTPPEKKEIG